jgi:hypothetical protein
MFGSLLDVIAGCARSANKINFTLMAALFTEDSNLLAKVP